MKVEPPPMRHVVKGWWIDREFNSVEEAERYLKGFWFRLPLISAAVISLLFVLWGLWS